MMNLTIGDKVTCVGSEVCKMDNISSCEPLGRKKQMNGLCISSYGLVCQHLRALCANECVSVKPCVLARMCVTKILGDLDLGSH